VLKQDVENPTLAVEIFGFKTVTAFVVILLLNNNQLIYPPPFNGGG
jgi:hypothetical protein